MKINADRFFDAAYWANRYEAQKLRNSGFGTGEIAGILNKGTATVVLWAQQADERDKQLLINAADPDNTSIKWGLSRRIVYDLECVGITTIGEAKLLCAQELEEYLRSWFVVPDRGNKEKHVEKESVVALRALLSCESIVKPVSNALRLKKQHGIDVKKFHEISRAKALLENNGYKVFKEIS